MWNQKMKGILLALGSLCLLQNASADVVDGFEVETSFDEGQFIVYTKKVGMDLYTGHYMKPLETHFICGESVSSSSNSTRFRTCFMQAKKGNYLDKKFKIQSYEEFIEFDCKAKRFREIFVSARNGPFGSGEEIVNFHGTLWQYQKEDAPMNTLIYATGCLLKD